MGVRDLIGRIQETFVPPVRDEAANEAIAEVIRAREAIRAAARKIEAKNPKLARELYKSADALSRLSKRMWSL